MSDVEFLEKTVHGSSYFSYGRKRNYICVCSVKSYYNFKVKNALVKSLRYVMEYIINILIMSCCRIKQQCLSRGVHSEQTAHRTPYVLGDSALDSRRTAVSLLTAITCHSEAL